MGRIEKDKNIVRVWATGKEKPYTLDINTGVLLGLRGAKLSTIPPMLTNALYGLPRTNITTLLRNGYMPSKHIAEYVMADRLDAIGYSADTSEIRLMVQHTEISFKDLAKWLKENNGNTIRNYISIRAKALWCEKNGLVATDHLTQDMIDWLYSNMREYSKHEISCFAYYLSRGLWEFMDSHYDMRTKLSNLSRWCNVLDMPMEKADFYRYYINMQRTYNQNKDKLMNESIRKGQERHIEALTFETEDFCVVIPTTQEELTAEGQAQNNCVGGYGNYIAEHRGNVVFIRRKSDPTTSYITCDIDCNGHIVQYLVRFNRSCTDELAREFKALFQAHLSTHWGE